MNVYDHIDANSRKTAAILCAFPAALFATVYLFALLLAKTDIVRYAMTGVRTIMARHSALDSAESILELGAAKVIESGLLAQALEITLSVYPWMLLTAFIWIWVAYRAGGSMILALAKARPVTAGQNRELFRLVENTAIMAGLPTPKIYLTADESMNAFATGRSPETSSIALTAGIVKNLSKAELQAVIAHELAHIGNRDTRLMQITVAGIGCFIFFGELLCRGASGRGMRGRRGGGFFGGFFMLIGVACLVFGYVIAPVLRFALSRVREYQADAAASKITHDPEALARALSKIAEDPRMDALDSTPLAGSMCIISPAADAGFVSVFINFISRLYEAHPPIEDRIAALKNMMGMGTSPQLKFSIGRTIW